MRAMLMSRALRRTVGRWLIGVLLLAQFAVASYACPGLSTSTAAHKGGDAMVMAADMAPGCDQMDTKAVNLCAEHCRFGQQSSDTAPVPIVLAPVPTLLYSLPVEPAHVLGSGQSVPSSDVSEAAAPSPPHAILHCVFRI
jgi:hypothetical protein